MTSPEVDAATLAALEVTVRRVRRELGRVPVSTRAAQHAWHWTLGDRVILQLAARGSALVVSMHVHEEQVSAAVFEGWVSPEPVVAFVLAVIG